MDDSEYYKLMNRTSRAVIMPAIKKSSEKLKKSQVDSSDQMGATTGTKSSVDPKSNAATRSNISTSSASNFSFTSLELRQGRADAEMLMEKKS